jgi:hypothetical protein
MKTEDDRGLEVRERVRVRNRVKDSPKKRLGIIMVGVIMLAAAGIGIIIGIVLVNNWPGVIKTDRSRNQLPGSLSATPASAPAASPVLSSGSKD